MNNPTPAAQPGTATPMTDAIAFHGKLNEEAYMDKMTALARQLERELAAKEAELTEAQSSLHRLHAEFSEFRNHAWEQQAGLCIRAEKAEARLAAIESAQPNAQAADSEWLTSDETTGIAAQAIWRQHQNKLDPAEQTSWEDAPLLGRGITLAYAANALIAVQEARRKEAT